MMMNKILSLLLLAFALSECSVFDKPLFILPSSYKDLNVSDPRNIHTFHRGLRAVGIEPVSLTLQSFGVKNTVIVSHFLAQYKSSLGFECWFKFSSWLISGVRGRLPTCVKSETDASSEQPSTTLPPSPPLRTTTTTERSKLTAQTESASNAEENMISFDSGINVVQPEEPEVEKEEKLVVSKKVDKSAGVSNTKKPKGATDPKKNSKKQRKVGVAVSASLQKVQGSVQDLLGEDSASKTPTVSSSVNVPSTPSQTKVSASLKGNLEVDKSSARKLVSIPVKKAAVEDKVVKLCFDGSLFVKTGGKWVPSEEGC